MSTDHFPMIKELLDFEREMAESGRGELLRDILLSPGTDLGKDVAQYIYDVRWKKADTEERIRLWGLCKVFYCGTKSTLRQNLDLVRPEAPPP